MTTWKIRSVPSPLSHLRSNVDILSAVIVELVLRHIPWITKMTVLYLQAWIETIATKTHART